MTPKKYFDEKKEFGRMETCAEKVLLAASRLENPYNLSDEDWVMYRDWLSKTGPLAVEELMDTNRLSAFPLLIKHRVIRKANINKFVDMAREKRKMDILSFLMNATNEFRTRPKLMDIAPKFVPGKSENNFARTLPDENAKQGDIVWLGEKPMPWLVMENKGGQLALISMYAFDCRAYNNTYYKKPWNDCALNKWLNSEFYMGYFTEREKEKILPVYIDNNDVLYHQPENESAESKLYLLSEEEVNRFFPTQESRKARITIVGRGRVLWQSFGTYAHWWLRTQSLDSVGQGHVMYNGDISLYGGVIESNGFDRFYDHYGVRPAMYYKP